MGELCWLCAGYFPRDLGCVKVVGATWHRGSCVKRTFEFIRWVESKCGDLTMWCDEAYVKGISYS